ncbi:MAG: signal peptidase II [Parvularculaceae bacterium]
MNGRLASWLAAFKAWAAAAKANPCFRWALAGAAAVAAIDQASKYVIVHVVKLPERFGPCAKNPVEFCRQIPVSPIFDLTFVQNSGASFGMLAGGMVSRVVLSLVSTAVVAGLVWWLARLRRPVAAAGVAFVIGGALGNLYDRLAYGYVIDFLDFSGLYFPFVFNLADASIDIGIGLLLLDAWRTRPRREGR